MRDQVALAEEARVIRKAVRPEGSASAFVVFGCGTIMLRKGVDLFLSCASAVASLKPQRPVRFAWIGSPVDPAYQIFLDEQVARAGLGDMVALLDEVADLGPAYELADLFFMCSRLDPLPNVAIDAALRGLPVVCFDKATGIAEALREDPVAGSSVVPYVDVQAAARLIADLADDPVAYAKISEATRRVAERVFDMDDYVRRLDGLGHEAMALIRQRKADFATISADSLFDFDLSAGRDGALRTRDEAIWHFLVSSGAAGVGRHQPDNVHYRRPCPGFHPKIYEQENIAGADRGRVNVLAHFIRSGKPVGSWSHEIITPDDNPDDPGELRVAVHGHFHYPELAPEFMRRLTANRLRCDLLLSTDSESKAAVMSRAVEGYDRGRVAIRVGRNRGRDIGPLLTLFGPAALAPYDIIGHFHGKRSLVLGDQTVGETWREFLWQNLLGGLHPMADVIVARLRQDQRLGLVFPEDPHLCGWDANYEIATDQARRLGLALPLPPFFDFPVGTMFWARTAALKPLFDLELGWDDYPAEPVPYDGTVLHAIERLLPFVARHAGYRFATTHIPGVAR
jgi:hypothetical protein